MAIEGVIFGLSGFCLFMLGGRIRTAFLYVMFILCLTVFAVADHGGGLKHFAIWISSLTIYAVGIAQDARNGGSVGKIGMWWWMFHYAATMRRYAQMPWCFCWAAAVCEIDSNPDWQDWTPQEAVRSELSYWSD